ncbi:MAG: PAS domain S-box protein [Deltaproteobacteria bacterium]|nr:PAS domain S-box protein [Deltaproteobacteria bacterium]
MAEKPTYKELETRVKELEKSDVERKSVENVAQVSKQEKKTILDSLIEHVAYQDTEMKIKWANLSACESANMKHEDIVGCYCYEIWARRSAPCPDCPVIKAMETCRPQAIERFTPDGRYWFIRGYPFSDTNGDILGGFEVVREITDQKHAEEKMRKSEEKYRDLYDNAPDMNVFIDAKTATILDCNRTLVDALGYAKEEIIRRPIFDICAPESANYIKEDVFPVFVKSGKIEGEELQLQRKDSSKIDVSLNVSAVHDEQGNILYGRSVWRDITHRNRLEKQLIQAHKMESIGTLSGGMAHDFNNLLAIILGNAELSMDDIPEENPAHFKIKEIQTAVLRAKYMVKQLTSFACKEDHDRTPVKINLIITSALKLLRNSISTNIDIRPSIPKKSETLLANPTQIKQAIINVCRNAAHAMRKQGGILEIKLEHVVLKESTARFYKLFPGDFIKLSISDTGHGIDPAIKDRIFDPYFTTRRFGEGSGMGLPVVYSIVRNHKGAISVDSERGKGTIVNMFFPIIEKGPVSG